MVIIVLGLPGSGKSYFASRLAGMIHAVHINSDRVRKEMFATRTYSPEEKDSVYTQMLVRMKEVMSRGLSVVIDATFYKNDIRNRFIAGAGGDENLAVIEIKAGDALVRERVGKQRADSEADFEIYALIKSKWEPLDFPHLVLESTENNIGEMLNKAAAYLHMNNDK